MYSHGAGVWLITPLSWWFWTAATLSQVFISLWKSNSQGEIAVHNNTDSVRWPSVMGKPQRHTQSNGTLNMIYSAWCYQIHWFCMELSAGTGWDWYQKIITWSVGVRLTKTKLFWTILHIWKYITEHWPSCRAGEKREKLGGKRVVKGPVCKISWDLLHKMS